MTAHQSGARFEFTTHARRRLDALTAEERSAILQTLQSGSVSMRSLAGQGEGLSEMRIGHNLRLVASPLQDGWRIESVFRRSEGLGRALGVVAETVEERLIALDPLGLALLGIVVGVAATVAAGVGAPVGEATNWWIGLVSALGSGAATLLLMTAAITVKPSYRLIAQVTQVLAASTGRSSGDQAGA